MTCEEIAEVGLTLTLGRCLADLSSFTGSSTVPAHLSYLSHPSLLSQVGCYDRRRPTDMEWTRLGREGGRSTSVLWNWWWDAYVE